MARPQSLTEQFRIARQATLEQARQVIAATARREHARVLRTEPRPAAFKRIVDGREDAPEDAVRADGVIVYRYSRLDLVVRFAMDTLFDRSPVLSGEYRNRHQLFVNGAAAASLATYRAGDEIVIVNFLPYSRKIEAGRMTMRVPGSDHVYQQAEQTVRRRYGALARVVFTYRGIIGGAVAAGKAGGKSENRYPALLIAEK